MGRHHRKLSPEDCRIFCNGPCSNCPSYQPIYFPPFETPPGPPLHIDKAENHSKHHIISTYLIITIAFVATTFFLLCCYTIYAKFFRSRRRFLQQTEQETHDDFLDEEHGPMVDHPIWYIRTTGLQESIISAIAVCKYKKGEGLIEGTECSVCLSEFQENENLRLLPKCNHAFHLPCIDTWLRSHTNCPMCRAPIVVNPAQRVPSLEPNPNVVNSSSGENDNTQMEVLENSGEISDGRENSDAELRNGEEQERQVEIEDERRRVSETEREVVNIIQRRRSVSLDSSAAAKIILALDTVQSVEESIGNSKRGIGNSKRGNGNENLPITTAKSGSSSRTRYLHSEPTSMKRASSYHGKHLLSWYSRSQKKPNAPLRSF